MARLLSQHENAGLARLTDGRISRDFRLITLLSPHCHVPVVLVINGPTAVDPARELIAGLSQVVPVELIRILTPVPADLHVIVLAFSEFIDQTPLQHGIVSATELRPLIRTQEQR